MQGAELIEEESIRLADDRTEIREAPHSPPMTILRFDRKAKGPTFRAHKVFGSLADEVSPLDRRTGGARAHGARGMSGQWRDGETTGADLARSGCVPSRLGADESGHRDGSGAQLVGRITDLAVVTFVGRGAGAHERVR
jgi:hypothetical protein